MTVRCPCSHDPSVYQNCPVGMYHCPECGEMVLAGVAHPKDFDDFTEEDWEDLNRLNLEWERKYGKR